MEPHAKLLQSFALPDCIYDVVRNCIHETVNAFCDKEDDEEQTMEEWVVNVRDTMHKFVAEAESQGLVRVGLNIDEMMQLTKQKMGDLAINF